MASLEPRGLADRRFEQPQAWVLAALVARLPAELTRADSQPRRRVAGVANPQDRIYNVHELAQLALENQELEPVVQAVGRVRPFTKPREIITFQCGQLPGVEYDEEFESLVEARRYFGVSTGRQRNKVSRAQQCAELRKQGLSRP